MHDMIHGGWMGNITTLNGKNSETFNVFAGERIRLRLINVANACSFALDFEGHFTQVITLNGQPIKPFAPKSGEIKLWLGQRADLIIDMVGSPGAHFDFADTYYSRSNYKFLTLVYED